MIVRINTRQKSSGGNQYEDEVARAVEGSCTIKTVYVKLYESAIRNIPHFVSLYLYYKFFYKGTLLLNNATTYFAGFKSRNIVIAHHIDSRFSLKPKALYQFICDRFLFNYKNRFDTVVVVSKFWEKVFADSGFKKVEVIYNSFDPEKYKISKSEVDAFRAKYNLCGKPVIYLGNCGTGKGVEESYAVLKDMDVYFVTSGPSKLNIPVSNLFLSQEEYRLLLASSDVVLTMSTFKEGWNRTAHEASLCGTPVVGSGAGGMRELLEVAGQTIVSDFNDLPIAVAKVLDKKYAPTVKLLSLNLEYFRNSWLNVLGGE